jgi:ABC-type phosphate/phosphonate transport system substrate-binding protein
MNTKPTLIKTCMLGAILLQTASTLHGAAQNGAQSPVTDDSLVISPVIDGDKGDYARAWKNFQRDLQANLDKEFPAKKIEVKVNEGFKTTSHQLTDLASGATRQIFALSCGNTAAALQNPSRYHYQTSFVLADPNNQPLMYQPIFIVTRSPKLAQFAASCSNLTQLAAVLDSHANLQFGIGQPSSLSSYRIPMLVMTDGHHKWNTTVCNHQGDLIEKVVSGEILAACVADDVLRVSGNWNRVQEFYVSGDGINPRLTHPFPAVSFGWRSDLPPELQDCISNTFANHLWLKDHEFTNTYKKIKGIPVGGIVKIDSADRLWADVIEIMNLPLSLPGPQ